MVKRIGTGRRKTRHQLKQSIRTKGKVPLSKYFQEFQAGDKVALVANPAVIAGLYFRRFHGRIGTIKTKKGRCYQVAVKDGKLEKVFNVHPLHLKKNNPA